MDDFPAATATSGPAKYPRPISAFDCVILGAGIVGAACALACTDGGMRVAVVERGPVGGGATTAAMGHVVLMSDSIAQFALTLRAQQLWEVLRPKLPARAEYQQIGTLWIAADAEELAEVERKQEYFAGLGVASAVWGPKELAAAEPKLCSGLSGALYMPGDTVLAPQAVAAWLLEQAVAGGASVMQGDAVRAGEGTVTLRDGRSVKAGTIVLATGADAAALLPGLPLRKRKGHLLITNPNPGYLRHQVAELAYIKSAHADENESVACNVQPRANGQLLIGSSRQYDVDDPGIEQHILDAMLARAIEYLPGLGELPIERAWTGFRAATPDKLPLIGPAGELAGGDPTLYLVTGHEGLGITTSLATAELLADYLLGRASSIPPEPYLPSRLAPASLATQTA